MQKIDYGDINKFLSSVGLVLITLSLLLPYLFLKEDLGLKLSKNEFTLLTEQNKKIISHKQILISKIQNGLPWVSGGLLFVGILTLGVGLFRWSVRQAILDKELVLNNDILEWEYNALNTQEKYDKAKEEIKENELIKQIDSITEAINESTSKIKEPETRPVLKYLDVESKAVDAFVTYKSPNFKIYSSQKLGNRYEIDLLMRAVNNKKYSDRIIEIKYFSNSIVKRSLTNATLNLSQVIGYYKHSFNRNVVPVLIVVYNNKNISDTQIDTYRSSLLNKNILERNMARLKVEFIEEKSLSSFDVRKVLKR